MNSDDVGTRVFSVSDRRIGTITAVDGHRFHVQTERGVALWLTEDCIFSRDGNAVTLICEEAGLPRYAVAVRDDLMTTK